MDREFSLGDSLHHGTLAATVLAQQAVSAAVRQLEGGIGDEDSAVENETGACDLDVSARVGRGQNTRGYAIRQAVLVQLVGQALHLIHLVGRRSGLFAFV